MILSADDAAQSKFDAATAGEAEFREALHKGSGRAMLLLQGNRNCAALGKLLTEACEANVAYDPQCEHDRVPYLCRLIGETGERQSYRDAMMRSLRGSWGPMGDYSRVQAFGILCVLAKDDPTFDRSTLYAVISEAEEGYTSEQCMAYLIWLEGFASFLMCLRTFYGSFVADFADKAWVFRSLIDTVVERDGEEQTMEALAAARRTCPELHELMQLDEAMRESEAKNAKARELQVHQPYATFRDQIGPMDPFRYPWTKNASLEEIEQVAADLRVETDEGRVWRYLQVFGRRDYPGARQELFTFLQHDNHRVVDACARALGRLAHADIRGLALEMISAGCSPRAAVQLLRSNLRPGDLEAVEAMADRQSLDEETWHGLGLAFLGLPKGDLPLSEERKNFLVRLYHKTPCSLCRGGFVEELFEAHEIPAWMAEEGQYDADPDTVQLCEKALAG